MLLDTGSAVTFIRQDVWEEITSCGELYQLEEAHRPIVVANGDRLGTLGQVVLPLHIGGIVEPFPVLVACQLTQECLIGADFLSHFRCHIDMGMKVLVAGETVVKFEIEKSHTSAAVCHTHFGESVEVPGYSQMQVTVGTNKEHVMTGAVMLEPSTTFMERHGLLVARSISYAHAGRMLVQLLNPSPVPAIVNKHERIGSLYPLDESGDTCAKHTVAGISVVHEHKADSIMEQMVMSTEGLIDEEKDKLRRLLREYKGIISLHDGDIGHTSQVFHHIDTGEARPIKQSLRRLPFNQRREVKDLIDAMLEKKVIEPSQSHR